MKKVIGIISHRPAMAAFYGRIFQELFGDEAEIVTGATEDGSVRRMKQAELYVSSVTSYDVMRDNRIKEYVNETLHPIRMDVTFSKAAVDLLRTYPEGTKALLVNQNKHMVMECIAQLYHLGISNIEFYPCYPGIERVPSADLTFTVGEPDLVPEGARHVVDIGSRLPSANVICEAALKLGDAFFLEGRRFKKYRNRLASVDYSLETISSNNVSAENRLEIILNALEEGIVCVNERYEITLVNKAARKMLDVSRSEMLGRPVSEALPELYTAFGVEEDFNKPRLLHIHGKELGAVLMPLMLEEKALGSLVTLQSFRHSERQQSDLRRQKTQRGHKAGARMEDIVGDSTAMRQLLELAGRMARSNAAILIQGEVGTGKSLLAQAIHNASPRAGAAFVQVNCAALRGEGTETALFGSAAASGGAGQVGLIECAHGGTLYLKDVDQLSPLRQAELLRVLEDREIPHPGAAEPVPIDLRIVSSSCADMLRLVREGSFRAELYYRLNVLSLRVPALRERRGDIPQLVAHFRRRLDADLSLTSRARQALLQHHWEGNVRELKNCVEYLSLLGQRVIDHDDLPRVVRLAREQAEQREEIERRSGLTRQEFEVLRELGESYREKTGLGRRAIAARCTARGGVISEHETREALRRLAELGYAEVRSGRAGSRLTEQGYLHYRRILYGDEAALVWS